MRLVVINLYFIISIIILVLKSELAVKIKNWPVSSFVGVWLVKILISRYKSALDYHLENFAFVALKWQKWRIVEQSFNKHGLS